jgi:hypothetical protein
LATGNVDPSEPDVPLCARIGCMLRIAGLPVWVGPSDVVTGARAVMGWTEEAV